MSDTTNIEWNAADNTVTALTVVDSPWFTITNGIIEPGDVNR